jgi:sulfur carrier protein
VSRASRQFENNRPAGGVEHSVACPGGAFAHLRVNGESAAIPLGSTVADLLAIVGLADQAVAVEINRDLVPRARHGSVVLGDGDEVEIVTLVGGG